MRRVMRVGFIALVMAAWAGRAHGQQPQQPPPQQPQSVQQHLLQKPDWDFQITPYFWMTGLHGQIGIRELQTNVALTFGDVVDALKFGVMGKFEADKGNWVTALDLIYVNVGDEQAFAIRGDTGSFQLKQHTWIVQPMGGYTLGDKTWGVDALVGLRYWDLGATLDVDPATRRPPNSRSNSRQWVDGLGGLRARASIPVAHVRVVLGGDAGRGGSHATWQYYGGASIDVGWNWSAGFAYRLLAVDYQRDNFLYNTRYRGPLIEATFRW